MDIFRRRQPADVPAPVPRSNGVDVGGAARPVGAVRVVRVPSDTLKKHMETVLASFQLTSDVEYSINVRHGPAESRVTVHARGANGEVSFDMTLDMPANLRNELDELLQNNLPALQQGLKHAMARTAVAAMLESETAAQP
jgi:hypothetical protein